MSDVAIRAVLFDKDGTLFDFGATWDAWAAGLISELSDGDPVLAASIARETGYDLAAQTFFPDSPVIAGTNRAAAECVVRALPGRRVEEIEALMTERACAAPLQPAVPLAPLLDGLRDRGLALGVVTNDTEAAANAHLRAASVADRFVFIAGFDSGYGMKPGAGPLLAFAAAAGIAPGSVAMVGDSTHDLIAGRTAGMVTVGVLTGPAVAADLTPLADVVLPDIGHIPAWLDGRG